MQEKTLQRFWSQLQFPLTLPEINGSRLLVTAPGSPNSYRGPDFLNCRFRVNGVNYAADAEIHLNSSHWFTHHHHIDPWYRKVLLHIVWENNLPSAAYRSGYYPPFVIELKEYFDRRQVEKTVSVPDNERLKKEATARLNKQISLQSLNFGSRSLQDQLYISLWQTCGYPHNTLPFTRLAEKLLFLLNIEKRHFNRAYVSSLFAYAVSVSGLLSSLPKVLPVLHSFCPFPLPSKLPSSRFALPENIWNRGHVHPVNHPLIKIGQFFSLLLHRSPAEITSAMIGLLNDRLPAEKLITSLHQTVSHTHGNGSSFSWISRPRIIEWLMTAAIPLFMVKSRRNDQHGFTVYLYDLFFSLPAGHRYFRRRLPHPFPYAWQYQGLINSVNAKAENHPFLPASYADNPII